MQQIQYPFQSDHDVIVALITDFNNSVEEFNKQMLASATGINNIQTLLSQQTKQTDARLVALENELKELDPKALAQIVRENNEWITNFNNSKHIAWVVACAAFTLIGYFSNIVFTIFHQLIK
jgi:hypothetical protein